MGLILVSLLVWPKATHIVNGVTQTLGQGERDKYMEKKKNFALIFVYSLLELKLKKYSIIFLKQNLII